MTKPKILVIDDEQELLDLLRLSLELEDFDVITAHDGEEGIAQFHEHTPDIIICDIIMPKKDGYEVLKEVKQAAKRWVPFIMLSAIGDFDKIKQAYEEQTDFYLTKPVDPWVISRNIKTLLNLAKQREE
jgi:DNA-binding response OmpR family regulator